MEPPRFDRPAVCLSLGRRHPCERAPGRHGKQAAMPAGGHGGDRGWSEGIAGGPGWLSREHTELDRAVGGFATAWLDLGSDPTGATITWLKGLALPEMD